MPKAKNLKGKVFGRLTAIEPTNQRKRGAIVWKCECSCGEIAYVARNNLEQGNTLSCGCLQAENVSKRNRERQTKDITGQRFGRLTAINPTTKRDNGYVIWKCICNCGKETYVNSHNLIRKNTLSCGCLNSEQAEINAFKNLSEFHKENFVAGTRIDYINNDKLNKNNTTGYKGVYLRKKDGKYTAQIEFQGKRYFLGSYNTKEEADKIRKQAEGKLYGDFLEWYHILLKSKKVGSSTLIKADFHKKLRRYKVKGKVTFNKSGTGSKSGRLTIPVALLEILGITEDDREVDIKLEDGKIIIEKLSDNE